MKQKEIFLKSEGDNWFVRNKKLLASLRLPDDDLLLLEIRDICNSLNLKDDQNLKVLEIGCGDGTRLEWLKNNLNIDCYGIDPSVQAVDAACKKGLLVRQGTADELPFESQTFDIVIFGFCLYLCDREDLFHIAGEADRVLKSSGWLMILDFYSATPNEKIYHHAPGVLTYKMDYRTLWVWHPNYECVRHSVHSHKEALGSSKIGYLDGRDEWISVSIIYKYHKDFGR